jgi:outer membrane lipoprotein SlyB
MTIRSRCMGLLVALVCCLSGAAALAQASAPVMRSFAVDQVAQLTPGTELVFRVDGTAGGAVSLQVDGVANLIGLPETRPGTYEGAYTISIKDKITFSSKAVATLRVGDRQSVASLVPTLLKAEAHAKTVAAAMPAPVMRSFAVDQVPQLSPGTQLVFRVDGTAGGAVSLRIDGVANAIVLPEARPGIYEGAYTISVQDKITFNSKAVATLKVGDRQSTATLVATLLTTDAHAKAVAAAKLALVAVPQINRLETRNSGALSGGHEITFLVTGTAGGKASISMDGGKTSIPLVEEKSGQYVGRYTIKSRDQFTDATPVTATLALGDKSATAVKTLMAGAVGTSAVAEAKCDSCGVVASVTKVDVKGKPTYVGAVAGGVVGGVLGNQIGGGTGKTVATVVGAVGGAVAGNEIEKNVRSETHYDVVVKLDNGSTKTVQFPAEPVFKVGAKVKLSGETLVPND